MILDKNAGKQYEYPLFLVAARKDPRVRDILHHAICILNPCKIDGHKGYRFIIGGIMWYIFVSSHMEGTDLHQRSSLKENDELWIYQNYDHVEKVLFTQANKINQK